MPPEIRIEFVEFQNKDLSDYTLIEGFPGMGLVGTIGAKYLVERLNFEEYGFIDSNIFMPIIRIHDGIPINPSRIYLDDKHKLIVLISEQIIPKQHINALAKAVVGWIEKKKITKLISLSGIHTDSEDMGEMVYGIATNTEAKKILEKNKIELIEEGITTGVTAVILLYLKNTAVTACSILGNVRIAADYKAAAELITKLNTMLGLNIDVKPLLKEAKTTEDELVKHLKTLQKTKDTVEKFETKTPMYT